MNVCCFDQLGCAQCVSEPEKYATQVPYNSETLHNVAALLIHNSESEELMVKESKTHILKHST